MYCLDARVCLLTHRMIGHISGHILVMEYSYCRLYSFVLQSENCDVNNNDFKCCSSLSSRVIHVDNLHEKSPKHLKNVKTGTGRVSCYCKWTKMDWKTPILSHFGRCGTQWMMSRRSRSRRSKSGTSTGQHEGPGIHVYLFWTKEGERYLTYQEGEVTAEDITIDAAKAVGRSGCQ